MPKGKKLHDGGKVFGLSGSGFGAPHEFVADGGEKVLGVQADEADGEGGAADVDGGVATAGGASRVDTKCELLAFDGEAYVRGVGDDDGAEG